MSDMENATQPDVAVAPAVTASGGLKFGLPAMPKLKVSFKEAIVCLLIFNGIVTAGLWYKVSTSKPPVIATVGVTALTRLYSDKVASDPNATPDIIKLKTGMFQDIVRKNVQSLAVKKGVMILARECVLTGESEDLTPQLEQSVNEAMKSVPQTSKPSGGLDDTLLQ